MAVKTIKRQRFNRIYRGDARMLAPKLADESIAVTITSPPYWGLKDYGVKNQIGWAQDYGEYLNDLIFIFRQVHRATVPSGSLWIVLDTFRKNGSLRLLPFEVSERLQDEIGWLLQDVIVWDKGKTLPWSRVGQMRNQFEYLLCFSKTKAFKYEIDRLKETELKEWWVKYPERYNPRGKVPSNIWTLPIPVQGSFSSNGLRHACPFPIALVERILLLTTDPERGNVVFDPFAGSGIVLALAEQMQRGFLGFELNPKFIEMYNGAVRKFVRQERASRSSQLNTIEQRRGVLQDKIIRLRLTKYPKTLLKRLNASRGLDLSTVRGVVAVAPGRPGKRKRKAKPNHLLALKVFLILDQIMNRSALEDVIDKVISTPPLSKFGIEAEVSVLTTHDIQTLQPSFGLSSKEPLWLYRQGKTYRFSGQTTLSKWLGEIEALRFAAKDKARFPIIASNIRVNQKLERTWFPKDTND